MRNPQERILTALILSAIFFALPLLARLLLTRLRWIRYQRLSLRELIVYLAFGLFTGFTLAQVMTTYPAY